MQIQSISANTLNSKNKNIFKTQNFKGVLVFNKRVSDSYNTNGGQFDQEYFHNIYKYFPYKDEPKRKLKDVVNSFNNLYYKTTYMSDCAAIYEKPVIEVQKTLPVTEKQFSALSDILDVGKKFIKVDIGDVSLDTFKSLLKK